MKMPKFTGFDHCQTPTELYGKLNREFGFDCDPCPLHANFDGLSTAFEWGFRTFVNPPYSNMTPWVIRALDERRRGNTVVMLLKCDTSTKLFQDWILPNIREGHDELRFVRGRITFPPRTKPAPFPSLIVVFRP